MQDRFEGDLCKVMNTPALRLLLYPYLISLDYASGNKIIDIGCETGLGTAFVSQHASETWGIDINKEAVDFACANYAFPGLTYLVQCGTRTIFTPNYFDVVLLCSVLPTSSLPDELLSEIWRICRPGGYLIASWLEAGQSYPYLKKMFTQQRVLSVTRTHSDSILNIWIGTK